MTDTDVDQPSPTEPAPPPPPRILAADPFDRVVPVLSTEPPKRKRRGTGRRVLGAARTACAVVLAAVIVLFALAALVDESEPSRSPSQSGSMRMR
jgi:hypothetical protein